MKKFSKLIALVLVLSLVFAFTACGKGGSDDTSKLGLLCSLTGNSQTNGGYAQQGAKMAVEEINAAGGINGKQIELVIEDDGGKADTAINAYNKLQSQKVVAIVGPMLSSLALAMDQNVQTGKIPLLIGATSAALTDNIDNPYFHRLRCSDTIMAEVAASYAVSNYGAKKIGIFYCSDDYGSGAMHTITKWCDANGVEYYEAGHNAGDKDLSTQILKVKEENCDVVIMWAHDDECALAARLVDCFNCIVAASLILFYHVCYFVLLFFQRYDAGFLYEGTCTGNHVLMQLIDSLDNLFAAGCVAETPAGHGVCFGEAV